MNWFRKTKIKNVERLANDVKIEAYQPISSLKQRVIDDEAVASKNFLGHSQMANKLIEMITQDFTLVLEDITDDTNIISSLNHKTILNNT